MNFRDGFLAKQERYVCTRVHTTKYSYTYQVPGGGLGKIDHVDIFPKTHRSALALSLPVAEENSFEIRRRGVMSHLAYEVY